MNVLQTERLLLQKAKLSDGQFFFDLLNSPTWIKFIGNRQVKSIDAAQQYIQQALIDSYQKHGFGLFKMVLKKEGIPIGLCGLVKRPTLDHADIGFAILPQYAGKGYTYEAAKATLDYAVSTLNLAPILAITTKDNVASKKLLEKIGLKLKELITFENGKTEFLLYST